MLSILIPTYNYDCTCLVRNLQQQAQCIGMDYEIIVADDASPISLYKERNREINELPHCRLTELTENVGRARIRNLLADEAQGEWLLFMDADAEVINDNFIANYLAHTDADVICGGLCHTDRLPSPEVSLRYLYEKRADKHRVACFRERAPYERFTPFNFMIRQTVFQSIRFDATITEYGHEDTLFGIELKRKNVSIRHINNPLLHTGLESNDRFIEKTRAALRNLATMESAMQGHSSLLTTYNLLHKIGLDRCVARRFIRKEQSLTARITGPTPSLPLFYIYKLGYYCSLKLKSVQ